MSTKQKNKQKSLRLWLFVALVLLPWFCIAGYVGFVAAPRYVSTSSMVIKQVSDQPMSSGGISALLGVNATSKEDALFLTEYILSHDMIERLDKEFDLKTHYRPNNGDFIYQLTADPTPEALRDYFKKRVKIELDDISTVLTVKTEGFSPEFALALNQAILVESEQFVNRLSKNVAVEQMMFSEQQLAEAEERLADAKAALLDYQNNNEVYDPQANAQMVNQIISGLQGQLASLRTEERQLLSYLNPEAPQVVALRSQIVAVEKQIRDEQAKLTSPDSSRLNAQTMTFESIKADVDFANELYKMSLSSVEKARLESIRKMKNLVVIASPHQAGEATYPRLGYVLFTSLIILLIIYGFVMLMLAVIRDHSK